MSFNIDALLYGWSWVLDKVRAKRDDRPPIIKYFVCLRCMGSYGQRHLSDCVSLRSTP